MTTDLAGVHWAEYAARHFEPRQRPWATPGDLARQLDRKTANSVALELIDRELVALTDATDHDALMILMPPQEGKSQRASRRYPEWLLAHDQALRIAIVSYEQEMALRWGRDIKNDIVLSGGALPISIRRDSTAAGRWETPQGGGVYCVGVGGPLTGKPVDVLIIDDPVKDRAWAESPVIREATWQWWESVALTRLAPGGKVVLIQTRWHQDDLAGRLLTRPGPLRWRVVKLPAIAGDADPLGRAAGEELPSVRGREPGHFRLLRATMSNYTFSGLYQQEPTAAEGNVFRRAAFRYWRPAPPWPDGREIIDCEGQPVTLADCWMFGTVDVAGSVKTSADYTVVCAWAVTISGDLVLMDRVRGRAEPGAHFTMADNLLAKYRLSALYVERGYFASTLVKDARAAGYPVAELVAEADKLTRALPAAGRIHAGKVWFPAETAGCQCGNCERGVWLDEWCDELAVFPQGTHDDQVDCLAYAALIVTNQWVRARPPARPGVSDHERAVQAAMAASTGRGNGSGEVDLLHVQW